MKIDNEKNLLQRIGERFDTFSPKQRILAKYILENYLEMAYATVADFAHRARVSETTVVRFVYSLEFESFSDFMGELREEIENAKSNRNASLDKYSFDKGNYIFPEDTMRAIFSLEISVMEETLLRNPIELFAKAVDKLYASSMILIVGCEANKCHSQATYFALDVLRPNVKVIEKFNLTTKGFIESIPKNTVCIVISTPRYPCETQSILAELRDCAHTPFVIGITDSILSPIVPYSDLVFQVPEKFATFIDTNAAYMSLIHAIAFGLYLKNPNLAKKRVEKYDLFVKRHNFYVRDYLDLIDFTNGEKSR